MVETVNTATTVESVEGTEQASTTTIVGQQEVETPHESASQTFVVGETSVYKDVDSLYKGAIEKEKTIQQLKQQNRELMERLEQFNNIENFREELKKMTEANISNNGTENTSSISEERIQEIAVQAMLRKKQEETEQKNLADAKATLQRNFGAEADNKFEAKCKELGMTKEMLENIAATNPKAFNKLMDFEQPASVQFQDVVASVHGMASQPAASSQGESYAERMTKDPRLCSDINFLKQMQKDLMEHPEKVSSLRDWNI